MKKLPFYLVPHVGQKPHECIDVYTDDHELVALASEFEGVRRAEMFEDHGMVRLHISPMYDGAEVAEALDRALNDATVSDVWRNAIESLPDDENDDSAEHSNDD